MKQTPGARPETIILALFMASHHAYCSESHVVERHEVSYTPASCAHFLLDRPWAAVQITYAWKLTAIT